MIFSHETQNPTQFNGKRGKYIDEPRYFSKIVFKVPFSIHALYKNLRSIDFLNDMTEKNNRTIQFFSLSSQLSIRIFKLGMKFC